MNEIANGWVWCSFLIFVIVALTVDTLLLNKKNFHPHASMRVAGCWVLVWISCALTFNFLLWFYLLKTTTPLIANDTALKFFTGYLIENSLSVDNLFMFYLVFTQLHIPTHYQQRILTYGIWGAIVFRLLFILMGTWLVSHFHWILYLMGAFLLITGMKLFIAEEEEENLADTTLFKIINKFFRATPDIHGNKFFIRKEHLLYATPLFVALVFIEISDIIFAFDSVPAIFAITRDPFIVWSSNIFAILGLRAMYFVLATMVERFHLLKYGIALILIFVGSKMVIAPWYDIPVMLSLSVIVVILVLFTMLSLQLSAKKTRYKHVATDIISLEKYAHYLSPRPRDWHKGLSGHVVIVGGDTGFTGAARLAAEAALRVGAGLVSIATRPEHAAEMNINCPEIMCHGIETIEQLEMLLAKANVVVLGPGLGQSAWAKECWQFVCTQKLPLVIDADGLNILSTIKMKNENWILTPHPGEAARLLNVSTHDIQKDRIRAINAIVKLYSGVCVLKGAGTLVLSAHSALAKCDKGNPGMSTAGMGDVLSGVIGGLLAQGVPLSDAAKLGVYMHALAGDKAAAEGERGTIATDLMPYLRKIANLDMDS